jgi:hypothetical protein
MVNYESWSDFELNLAASKFVKFEGLTLLGDEYKEEVTIVEVFDWGVQAVGKFDPCNDWGDLMPLVVESEIQLNTQKAKRPDGRGRHSAYNLDIRINHGDDKSLNRAAVACFIDTQLTKIKASANA